MKGSLKASWILFITSCAFFISGFYFWPGPKVKSGLLLNKTMAPPGELARLKSEASVLKIYITANHYNSKICFLADLATPSGRNRFFIYDLQKDSVLLSGLVAHGSCDNNFQVTASFSNKINSGCSCLGKFRVGDSYIGRFGLAYKLYGLDSSNSNAYKRSIVLHAYECVPGQEIYPLPICNSRGCPMVSTGFLQKLKPYIEKSTEPILLNLFE